MAAASSSGVASRLEAPPIYNKIRGSKELAMQIAKDPHARAEALRQYRKDQKSAGDISKYTKLTWATLHVAWWSFVGVSWAAFPLTPDKIEGVGSL